MKKLLITAIIILASGFVLTLVGSLFKLEHLPGASAMLTAGLLTKVIGVIILAVYFVKKVQRNPA